MGLRGGICMTVVVAILIMVMGNLQLEAQVVSFLSASAPFGDAAAVVQQLRVSAGVCCPSDGHGFCTTVATAGNAAASVCGSWSPADVGNILNQVLAQCNINNSVQGAYSPDGTSQRLLYLTSNAVRP